MTFIEEWQITLDQLDSILRERPSLRGMLLGFVAEYKLTEIWFAGNPEIKNLQRFDNHVRREQGDFGFVYKGVPIVVQVKSLQRGSIKKTKEGFKARFQRDASDRRNILLPNGQTVETTCLQVSSFDLLAVNLFDALNRWEFAFACRAGEDMMHKCVSGCWRRR